jgi:flagellar hook-basal body complex protein FliE
MAEPIAAINPLAMGESPMQGVANVVPVAPENATPFQVMLDNAVSSLESVSAVEEKADAYIAQYAKGNVSMEEALMEVTKMTMAVELVTSIVNQTVTTFKEIQQMPV